MVRQGKLPDDMGDDHTSADDLPDLGRLSKSRAEEPPAARKAPPPAFSKQIGVLLDRPTYLKLRDYSIRSGRAMSEICRQAVVNFLAGIEDEHHGC